MVIVIKEKVANRRALFLQCF